MNKQEYGIISLTNTQLALLGHIHSILSHAALCTAAYPIWSHLTGTPEHSTISLIALAQHNHGLLNSNNIKSHAPIAPHAFNRIPISKTSTYIHTHTSTYKHTSTYNQPHHTFRYLPTNSHTYSTVHVLCPSACSQP